MNFSFDSNGFGNVGPYQDGNPRHIDPSVVENYTIKDYGIDVQGVKDLMFGIRVQDPETGKTLGDKYYENAINTAIANVQKRFDIQILPKFQLENQDYDISQFHSNMYLRLRKRPVLQVEDFQVTLNGQRAFSYPANWWKVNCLGGTITMQPTMNMAQQNYMPIAMMPPAFGNPIWGNYAAMDPTYASQIFRISYVAGMLPPKRSGVEEDWEFPVDLARIILSTAAKYVFEAWGRLIAGPGIAAKSFSMDGIDESLTTTQSAMYGGAYAEIRQLDADIQDLANGLDAKFGRRIGLI